MKLLVMSDSHGSKNSISKIVDSNLDAQIIIHLGDGENDMEYVPFLNEHADIIAVRGNCDISSMLPVDCVRYIEGHMLYCTHGHVQQVKQGVTEIIKTAGKYNADIVLYGHTHAPVNKCENGMRLFNPGSVKQGFYGVVNINDAGAVFEHRLLETE